MDLAGLAGGLSRSRFAGNAGLPKKHWRWVLFYQYLQWQIDLQLRGAAAYARDARLSIGLYHDLALATDRFGSDLWAHRPFFVSGCRVGSPPDDFAPKGPGLGLSAARLATAIAKTATASSPNPSATTAATAARCASITSCASSASTGFPTACDATEGAYVREISEDFIRILALESVRKQVIVMGEDLGTVEPDVRETLARFGILSYRLFYFEKHPDGEIPPLRRIPGAGAGLLHHARFAHAGRLLDREPISTPAAPPARSTPTPSRASAHRPPGEKQKMLDRLFELGLMPDGLPLSAAAYPELTGESAQRRGRFPGATAVPACWPSTRRILTKEPAQQNLPGTTWQYPNWGRKMRFTVEQLRTDPEARGFTAMFRNWIIRAGRENR